MFEERATSDVFLAHAKYNVERKTKMIIIENVSDSGQGHSIYLFIYLSINLSINISIYLSIISVYLSWEGWERWEGLRGWKGQNGRNQLITIVPILLFLDLKSMILKGIRKA